MLILAVDYLFCDRRSWSIYFSIKKALKAYAGGRTFSDVAYDRVLKESKPYVYLKKKIYFLMFFIDVYIPLVQGTRGMF